MTDGHDPLPDLDALLAKASAGDRGAVEQVRLLGWAELNRIARLQLARQPKVKLPDIPEMDLVLVDEAFLKLFGDKPMQFRDTSHFLAVAAAAMHVALVDHQRRQRRRRRS
jgi:hypothetical protein